MTADEPTLVFVYGTLMRGECRHHALAGQVYLGDATTAPCYRLFLVDDFPGLVEVDHQLGNHVAGELWSVDQETLTRLDQIECVAEGLYQRRSVQLADNSTGGSGVVAWFYLPSVEGLQDCGCDWRLRPRKPLR